MYTLKRNEIYVCAMSWNFMKKWSEKEDAKLVYLITPKNCYY